MSQSSNMWIQALTAVSTLGEKGTTLASYLPTLAAEYGVRPALVSEEGSFTYAALAARVDQYTTWALAQGIGRGDVVCMMLPNCAEYVAIWLGITGAGGVVALLNTSLRPDALRHAIASVAPRHVIAATAFAEGLEAARGGLPPGITWWLRGGARPGWSVLDPHGLQQRITRPQPALTDTALHIYTSGTTGLPKAVHISHGRVLEWSLWFAGMMGITLDDRMYDCLPMYHSIGGVVAVGAMLVRGGSVLIRPAFSVSHFWDDVVDGGCTVFQYIGELCRYLLNSSPNPRERQHILRLACGNGMQAEVWTRFVDRFQVPRILEYYAATEGALSLYNADQRPGAIGRIPPYLAHRFPMALIRLDPALEEPLRDSAGYCQRCGPDEPGEAIGPAPATPLYTDKQASAAKLLHNVFMPGDAWFRTGDLMRRDRAGFYCFVDRLGDTFRWKGENVSTAEAANVIGACPGVLAVAVYGVTVPGMEGRAGMAVIMPEASFNPAALHGHLAQRLAEPAQPVFLRLRHELDSTGTFKPLKASLARDGFNPASTPDPLFMLDRAARRYVPLDGTLFARICEGLVRL